MKAFKPTADQVRLAEAVMTAMAFESTIRPIVEAYEQEILAKHQFRIARKWVEQGIEDQVILKRNRVFLLSEEDRAVFYAESFAARDAAGLKVEQADQCPLSVAEGLSVEAVSALLEAMATIPGIEKLGSAVLTLEQRQHATDLSLRLLAPHCASSAEEILKRYIAGES
jgi:hypothetical protein